MEQITYRPATTGDRDFLFDMLAEGMNWRGDHNFDRSLLESPEIAHYVRGWKRDTDFGVIAERGGQPVGAAWSRLYDSTDPGYGYVADDIPEISLAVVVEFRGQGLGTALMDELIQQADGRGVGALSLSVEDGNRVRALYERLGFLVVGREGNSDTMVLRFT